MALAAMEVRSYSIGTVHFPGGAVHVRACDVHPKRVSAVQDKPYSWAIYGGPLGALPFQ